MLRIEGGPYDFQVSGIMIEGKNEIGVDVQYPWEDSPRRYHQRAMTMSPFFIDKYPVTNAQFKKFLDATHYRPNDDHNFLKTWSNGTYPPGSANQPVVWVSIEDARAFATWAGKRLPHEWEWQYAAQGSDGRTYPWGNGWDSAAVPTPDTARTMAAPSDVGAHPKGASPFGVQDLIGNVWQMTDEVVDDHTSNLILKGGSHYQPAGSHWYFPQAYKANEHGKYLLIAPSKDRSGAVGFRCVMDAA
jgi:formylglycine-generating enzyme required for sulfatase activity